MRPAVRKLSSTVNHHQHHGPETNPISKHYTDFRFLCNGGASWKIYQATKIDSKQVRYLCFQALFSQLQSFTVSTESNAYVPHTQTYHLSPNHDHGREGGREGSNNKVEFQTTLTPGLKLFASVI